MKKLLVQFLLFSVVASCSGFVNKVHQQISMEESGEAPKDTAPGSSNPYPDQAYGKLKTKGKDKLPIKDPISFTLSGDENQSQINQTPLQVKKRFNVADFVDSDPSGSLWSDYDDTSSFFATANSRKSGDIVVINILESMKNSISKELRKSFPLAPIFQSNSIVNALNEEEKPADDKTPATERAPASATEEKKEDTEVAEIVYDKISSRVAHEVSKEHVLLKGRKEVYFRNKKRLIEIHGLVKKSDIDPTDSIKSDQLIESKIFIIQ
jgi:flagellar L-ring protein precursor FlgH